MGKDSLFVVAVLPLLTHCGDPHMVLRGSVHRGLSTPVIGATVRTECPPADDTYGDLSTKTKSDGSFSTEGIGSVNKECHLEVVVPGDSDFVHRFRALDYCADGDDVSCTTVEARIELP